MTARFPKYNSCRKAASTASNEFLRIDQFIGTSEWCLFLFAGHFETSRSTRARALLYGCLVLLSSLSCDRHSGIEQNSVLAPNRTIAQATIWANEMPGTREIRQLEVNSSGFGATNPHATQAPLPPGQDMASEILAVLEQGHVGPTAPSSFAVSGSEIEALREAHSVLALGQEPRSSFSQDDRVSVVFFSYPLSYFVHITDAEVKKNQVIVRYALVPHTEPVKTQHLAIIPLPQIPYSQVDVIFERLPMDGMERTLHKMKLDIEKRVVCQPFSFQITGPEVQLPPTEEPIDLVAIPLSEVWASDMPGTIDIRELEPEKFGEAVRELNVDEQLLRMRRSYSEQILSLLRKGNLAPAARQGFAVVGTGLDALSEAYAVLCQGNDPQTEFSEEDQISIIFFSYLCSFYVELVDVTIDANTVTVRYRFVFHSQDEMTATIAIIPLPSMTSGVKHVKFARFPMRESPQIEVSLQQRDPTLESQVVSQRFVFRVNSKKE